MAVCTVLFTALQEDFESCSDVSAEKSKGFSIAGVSMCGGIAHNIGQLLVAMAVVDNFNLFYYLPVLLISGLVTGLLIGILGNELQRRLPKEMFK